jgi:hypothetical protein
MRSKEFIQEANPFSGMFKDLAPKLANGIKDINPPKPTRDNDVNRLVSPQEARKAQLGMKLMNGPKRLPLPGSNGMNIVKSPGNPPRIVVVVDVDGIPMPFYISTGSGGKTNPPGHWYEFWGVGPNGWFNKTTQEEIDIHYGSAKLKAVCDQLDSTVGDIRNMADIIPVMTPADVAVMNTSKRPLSSTDVRNMTPEEFDRWAKKVGTMGRTL